MKKSLTLFLVVELFVTNSVSACGPCVFGAFDSFLPPIYLWCLVAVSWFLVNGVLATFTQQHFGQPRFFRSGLVVLVAVILGGMILGPVLILPLAFPPALEFTRSISRRTSGRRAVVVVGAFHLLAVIILAVFSWHIARTRTDGQYIVQWSRTGPGTARMLHLEALEPASLSEYRYIVSHGSGRLVAEAAQRIATISNHAADGRLLESALKRESGDPAVAAALKAAILELK